MGVPAGAESKILIRNEEVMCVSSGSPRSRHENGIECASI